MFIIGGTNKKSSRIKDKECFKHISKKKKLRFKLYHAISKRGWLVEEYSKKNTIPFMIPHEVFKEQLRSVIM